MTEPQANRGVTTRPRIGVSACLLGQEVRYNGAHKREGFIVDVLARYAELFPVCPEVELGLGTPREPIQLAQVEGDVRLLGVESGLDLTERMTEFARRRAEELAGENLSGFIFKQGSPSCGVQGVPIWRDDQPAGAGRGLFAQALIERLPRLPVAEEGQLRDPQGRADFCRRVFALSGLACPRELLE